MVWWSEEERQFSRRCSGQLNVKRLRLMSDYPDDVLCEYTTKCFRGSLTWILTSGVLCPTFGRHPKGPPRTFEGQHHDRRVRLSRIRWQVARMVSRKVHHAHARQRRIRVQKRNRALHSHSPPQANARPLDDYPCAYFSGTRGICLELCQYRNLFTSADPNENRIEYTKSMKFMWEAPDGIVLRFCFVLGCQ